MEPEPTIDPTCWIVDKGDGFVVYETHDLERWVIRGTCNCCGSCEVGTTTESELVWVREPGQPGACFDPNKTLDNPVRPDATAKWPGCTLTGEYL